MQHLEWVRLAMKFLKDALAVAGDNATGSRSAVRQALSSLCTHLGMEVAYVSKFVGNNMIT